MKKVKKIKQVTRKGYESYVKDYKAGEARLAKKGITPEAKMLSFRDWKETYKSTRNTLKEEVLSGKRKQIGNINERIVSRQMYKYSLKQAKAIKEAADVTGQKLTLMEIRGDKFDWSQISESYTDWKAQYGSADAKALVSWYYFGSE